MIATRCRLHGALLLTLGVSLGATGCKKEDQAAPAQPAVALEPIAVRSVSFKTEDEGTVYADEYGSGARAVVLAHGARFDKASWRPQAEALARAGLRVLAIDFRGYGASRGGTQWKGRYDGVELDVLAAVRHLRASGATTVAVLGASFGGFAAAQAAASAEPGTIDRLVLLAPNPIEHPERMQGQKLFIVARDDLQGLGTPVLTDVRDQHDRAPGPKELLILEGSAHAQFLFDSDQAERLLQEIVRFLTAP